MTGQRLRGKPCDHSESSHELSHVAECLTGGGLSGSDSLDTGLISSRSFERHICPHIARSQSR